MAIPLRITRGSSLNLRWGKYGIWLSDWWIPSLCVSLCLSDHRKYEDSDVAIFFLCFIAISIWDIDLLIMLIDYLACLNIVTLVLPWFFYSPHMYKLTIVYLLTWCVDSIACILSWSFFSMLSLSLFILIVIAYVWTWMVYMCFAWLLVAWPSFFYVIACFLFVWVAHLSPYLQPSGIGLFFIFGSYICKCEALCVLVYPTELDVRGRV